MPICVCPHCKARLAVKDTQLNLAQGFVVCTKCEGLFQAKHHISNTPHKAAPEQLPGAATDTKLVRSIGSAVRQHKALSKNEIADLLDSMIPAETKPAANARAVHSKVPDPSKEGFNWTLAVLTALTVLIMQLFYLILML
ncbi:MJ0042-type zinc finger domain-containing protein [Neisseria musculi]|uniref:MJ0042 family finger-like domain protein n=1 Tax=Neisseria musculi TaxID=1815583 RepID=A0A7H1MBN7_9NEIS|nr:MJ0042-type zinc finger domain-containing protein [Neisseria musculi]QNT59052.1 MJ0042 family finger-like domain protein [Neisseria musculi]